MTLEELEKEVIELKGQVQVLKEFILQQLKIENDYYLRKISEQELICTFQGARFK